MLYQEHYRHVYAYCLRRSNPDSVDDLVAEVYLTVWRKIPEAPTGADALRWLYRIAHLVLTNHWRTTGRRRRLRKKLDSIGLDQHPSLVDHVVVRQEVRAVLEAATRLRAQDQEVLKLALWEHLSMDQIGEVLGVNANTAKQRLHRARKALVNEYQRSQKTPAITPAAQEGGG